MTKTRAINQVRQEVSDLYRFGGEYKYNSYDPSVNAWRESNATNFYSAQHSRSQCLLDKAKFLMDRDYIPYNGGRWTDYL